MFKIPIPDPIRVEIVGAKIAGVKTHRINIFDAWKDQGVMLRQPLAKYKPPKNIDEIVKIGIAESLNKQRAITDSTRSKVQENLEMQQIYTRIQSLNNKPHPAYEAVRALRVTPTMVSSPSRPMVIPVPINAGGATWDWGAIGDTLGGIGGAIWSGLQGAGETLKEAGSKVTETVGEIGKVWDALVHLADLINDMYSFMKEWKTISERLNAQLLSLTDVNKALTEFGNKLILENRQFYAHISQMLNESLAKYFDDLTFNLIKYGQVEVPTAVVGAVTVAIKNNSAIPMTITIPNLTIKSGPYTLHKGLYVVNALPFETDVGEVPFDVKGVEEAKYMLDIKKKGGVLPLQITGTAVTPFGQYKINISKTVKI